MSDKDRAINVALRWQEIAERKDAELTHLRARIEAADKLAETLVKRRLWSGGLPGDVFDALSAYEATREPQPTEYEIKLAQLKEDFPNGI